VLGHLDLNQEQAKIAIRALKDAVAEGDANTISGCIIHPRHALRFKSEGNTYDILICYPCGQLELFKSNRGLPFEGKIGGKPDVLNGLLNAAQITLADTDAALNESYVEEAKIALKRAQEGDAKAQNVIARMLMSGRGEAKDETEGIKWLAKSLGRSLDDPEFQVELGGMYENGKDVDQNSLAALGLYQKAAAQGSRDALLRIAFLYEYGEGIKNPAKAIELYRQAAENGSAEAQFEVGMRYARGWELKKDYSEALKWLRKAAEQCHPDALNWMGNMYEKGWGVTKDPVEAYFWDRLAVAYGHVDGTAVSVSLTPEQHAFIDKRLVDWNATHPKPPAGRQLRRRNKSISDAD
jgi:tetratricopeptide (TPR) repeat protein